MSKSGVVQLPKIHPEGIPIIIISVVVSFLCLLLSDALGCIALLLTVFVVYFFRDPDRVSPEGDDIVVSPADGVVLSIKEASAPSELKLEKKKFKRISIFLNVFDVHVNRVPANGTIKKMHYKPGKFVKADDDEACNTNERQTILMTLKGGKKEIVFCQVAGLIARRIVCYLKEGESASLGDRFGIIRFGSRMDIYVPMASTINVLEGQRVVGGETLLAKV